MLVTAVPTLLRFPSLSLKFIHSFCSGPLVGYLLTWMLHLIDSYIGLNWTALKSFYTCRVRVWIFASCWREPGNKTCQLSSRWQKGLIQQDVGQLKQFPSSGVHTPCMLSWFGMNQQWLVAWTHQAIQREGKIKYHEKFRFLPLPAQPQTAKKKRLHADMEQGLVFSDQQPLSIGWRAVASLPLFPLPQHHRTPFLPTGSLTASPLLGEAPNGRLSHQPSKHAASVTRESQVQPCLQSPGTLHKAVKLLPSHCLLLFQAASHLTWDFFT